MNVSGVLGNAALPGPLHGFTGARRPRGQKWLKKVGQGQERVKNNLFSDFSAFTRQSRLFSTFFRLFCNLFDPGAEGPGTFCSTFLEFRVRKARMTPVRGQGNCKHRGFARLRQISARLPQTSHEGARMLPVSPRTCLTNAGFVAWGQKVYIEKVDVLFLSFLHTQRWKSMVLCL